MFSNRKFFKVEEYFVYVYHQFQEKGNKHLSFVSATPEDEYDWYDWIHRSWLIDVAIFEWMSDEWWAGQPLLCKCITANRADIEKGVNVHASWIFKTQGFWSISAHITEQGQ